MSSYELINSGPLARFLCDIDREYVIKCLKKHGAVLFRGFSADLQDFITFSDQFCDEYVPSPSHNRRVISKDEMVQTVDIGQNYFPLHSERSQTPFRADIAFFYCRRAPQSGGQTFFCDGSLLAAMFPDEIKKELKSQLSHLGGFYT